MVETYLATYDTIVDNHALLGRVTEQMVTLAAYDKLLEKLENMTAQREAICKNLHFVRELYAITFKDLTVEREVNSRMNDFISKTHERCEVLVNDDGYVVDVKRKLTALEQGFHVAYIQKNKV